MVLTLQNVAFPTSWKVTLVRPLKKIPLMISTQFYFCKTYPNLQTPLVQSQPSDFSKNNLSNHFQSRFQSGYSTQSSLTEISQDFHKAMDQQKFTLTFPKPLIH